MSHQLVKPLTIAVLVAIVVARLAMAVSPIQQHHPWHPVQRMMVITTPGPGMSTAPITQE